MKVVHWQCQRSHVVMCWPKSRIMSPFLLMAAGCLNGRKHDVLQKPVGACTSYDVIARWLDLTRFFLPKVAQMMPHKLCKISARSAQPFGGHFRKTHGGCITPPPLRVRVKSVFCSSAHSVHLITYKLLFGQLTDFQHHQSALGHRRIGQSGWVGTGELWP